MRIFAARTILYGYASAWLLLNMACASAAGTAPAGTPAADVGGARAAISRYQQEISNLQSRYGASDPRLGEARLGLGLALRAAGEHDDAADAFKDALYNIRINHGLESLDQIPYLNRLIEENTTLGRWKRVNNNYLYLYWVYKRNYGDNDPRLLPVINRVTRVQTRIFNAKPELFNRTSLLQREAMFSKAIDIIETHFGEQDPRLLAALYRAAMNNYYMALQTGKLHDYIAYKNYMRGASSDDLFTRVSVPVVEYDMSGHPHITYEEAAVPNPSSQANLPRQMAEIFRQIDVTEQKGRKSLQHIEDIINRQPGASPYARALAITHEGDWQVLFANGRGWGKYDQAWQLLQQVEHGDAYIDLLFGRPHPLPASDPQDADAALARLTPAGNTTASTGATVNVLLDVTAGGQAINIRVGDLPEGVKNSTARSLKWYVAGIRFRPRLEQGKPVMAHDVNLRYAVNDQGRITARIE